MSDLSDGKEPTPATEVATGGAPGPSADSAEADDEPPPPDTKIDDVGGGASGAAGSPSAPMAAGCQLVTFTPSTTQSIGGGQPWGTTTNALADDGANATAPLSTDNRESALLVFGGFTGPAIPANAIVKGFLVDVDRSAGGTCIVAKSVVATIGGAPRVRPDATDPWQGVRFYGGVEDTWGAPIPPADVGGSLTVGVQTRLVGSQAECRPREARVDTLRVRVHYCVN
jgi:hypothetical protein